MDVFRAAVASSLTSASEFNLRPLVVIAMTFLPFLFALFCSDLAAICSPAVPAPPIAGSKRAVDEALVAIDQIAPSSFGLPKRNHSWARQYQNLYMKAHRPTAAESGIHVSLISPILGQFCQNVDTINLDRQDYAFCAEFCGAMSGAFESEEARMTVANLLLEGYFRKPIQRLSGQSGQWRTGGSIVAVCRACSDLLAGVMHVQYKGDLCGGGAAPHEQNQAYYMKGALQCEFARLRTACPALLVQIAGPNMGISAAVHAQGPCFDPVVPMLPLMVLKHDTAMMIKVARALRAAKEGVDNLTEFYERLPTAVPPEEEIEQLKYPYPRDFKVGAEAARFTYDGQVGEKLVFLAHVTSAAGGLQAGQQIIVKFAKTYSPEVHQRCYDHEQSAPRLYAHAQLVNGWHMVVMERVAGRGFGARQEEAALQQRLRSVVQHLHAGGFVHGDLRANNVLVEGGRVCLLDFDWSGPAGQQLYPAFMNHTQIDWPEAASDGKPLEFEHDNVWLGRLIGH
jgi:hypothetical protein